MFGRFLVRIQMRRQGDFKTGHENFFVDYLRTATIRTVECRGRLKDRKTRIMVKFYELVEENNVITLYIRTLKNVSGLLRG